MWRGNSCLSRKNSLMQPIILKEVLRLKKEKKEFSIITDINNAANYIYSPQHPLPTTLEPYAAAIKTAAVKRTNGMIAETSLFIDNYHLPIKVFIVGAVHIAQYFCDFARHLNFETIIIDPRGYFTSKQRFPETKVINKWPNEAFLELPLHANDALIALTHDPKIDDPALSHALTQQCFYIGALGSKKSHASRCQRLQALGFTDAALSSIHGPIGIKLGGRAAPEIALSIIAQLVTEVYKR